MEYRFTFNRDKRCRWLSMAGIVTIIAILGAIIYFSESNYVMAWSVSIAIAIILLFILSIPRYIKVTAASVEIHCVVELTTIKLLDIKSIREVERGHAGFLFPALASYGFFGYYGYYINFSQWDTVKIYATEWKHFVEIEDIYEQKYIVSCRQSAELLCAVAMNKKLKEDAAQMADE